MFCQHCGGEGRIFKSKYGGNDPDVWDAGKCEVCEGSGKRQCERHGCDEIAVGVNGDGEALCEDCLIDWEWSEAVAAE